MIGRLFWILVSLAILVLIVVSIWRPARIYGIGDKQVESSLASSVGNGERVKREETKCTEGTGGAWACNIFDRQTSRQLTYRLQVGGDGCWDGTLTTGPPIPGLAPQRLSDCLSLTDYIRI
jgi:hypothetical protein